MEEKQQLEQPGSESTNRPVRRPMVVALALLLLLLVVAAAVATMHVFLLHDEPSVPFFFFSFFFRPSTSSSSSSPPLLPSDPIAGTVVETEDDDELPIRTPEPWDISQDHDRRLDYAVTEGTWMNLDLSPDGANLVFDMVGDLYAMPVAGGAATLIKGGVAYDVQPRFSPDGQQLLFTSDESGCDNIWIADVVESTQQQEKRRGAIVGLTNFRQVTNEPYRFVSNGMWSPDGKTIVAVKWFTSTRSIPAGEIWTYPLDSIPNAGTQRVGRSTSTSQIGPEEPTYSPDGAYIYYSQNTADSAVYQYSKNEHAGVYVIRRCNVTSGAIESVTGGSGGAIRPILSHDGGTLAFLRRTVFQTSLVLRDLQTGNERILFKDCSIDQQSSSAPHGVYPRFSWSPDDQHIYIWAHGHIQRITVADGTAVVIPMQVDVSLQLADTVLFPVDPSSGDSFSIKVAQYATVHFGDVYYTALGRTYMKRLPSGDATLVTSHRSDSQFEYFPAVSHEYTQLAQVVWDDQELARVEIVNLRDSGIDPFYLDLEPGRYTELSWSPADDALLVVRTGSNSLTGPTYALRTGVYVIDLESDQNGFATKIAASRMVSSAGTRADFSGDGQYVLLQRNGGAGIQLVQIDRSGQLAEVVLAESKYATSMQLSPDMDYLAFVEFNHVFVAPFDAGTAPVAVSARPGHEIPGVLRCTRNGGEFVAWTDANGGAPELTWLLGPTLSCLSIADVLPACSGNDDNDYGLECVESHTRQYDLSFVADSGVADETYVAFDNAVIVTMAGEDEASSVIPNGRLIVRGDRIEAVGSVDDVSIPPEATYYDLEGGVILPGFIDAHAHWGGTGRYGIKQSYEFLLSLAFGVTSMHNPSIDTIELFADAELVRSGKKTGPRLFGTGTILYGADGTYRCEINSLDDARQALSRLAAYGAWSAKSYQQPCRSSRQRVLAAAREMQFNIVPEGGMNFFWNGNQIIDGHTTIEHTIPVAPLYDDLLQLFASSGTSYIPTLVVSYGGLYGERYWYQTTNLWENERLMRFHPTSEVESASLRREKADDRDYLHFNHSRSVKAIADLGGKVALGAHGQRLGIAFHWELWMMTQGGMSNFEALRAATQFGAESLGLQELGVLRSGYLADLVVYPANRSPLENIYDSEHLQWVMKDGRLYDAASMDQLLPTYVPLPAGPELNIPTVTV